MRPAEKENPSQWNDDEWRDERKDEFLSSVAQYGFLKERYLLMIAESYFMCDGSR